MKIWIMMNRRQRAKLRKLLHKTPISYLRPPSDLREDEIDEMFRILGITEEGRNWIKINDCTGIKFILPDGIWAEQLIRVYDYLDSIHIDYRGLIQEGLAKQANKEFYKHV